MPTMLNQNTNLHSTGFWFVLLVLLFMPLVVWIVAEGNPLDYLTHNVPAGQSLYVMTKLMGLYAFFLLWLHILWVVLKNTGLRQFFPPWRSHYHQKIAWVLVLLVVIHVVLFVTAVSLRKGAFAYSLFIPDFSDYYHSLLALGTLAFWLLPLIVFAGVRLKSGQRKPWLHRFAFLFFLLVFVHGLGVGSETKSGMMFWTYLFMGASVAMALLYRLFIVLRHSKTSGLATGS